MGCNTSKEASVALEGEQNKEINNEDREEAQCEDKQKPESAKTVTLTSNGFVLPSIEQTQNKVKQESTEEKELEEAAVKIQAAFRGHKTRQSMKQPAKHEENAQNLEEEFDPDDKELTQAATKIQASFRGHMIRKQMEKKEDETSPSSEKKHEEEELDIDLTDPELNKAAIKIQASFRGHMTRKDHEDSDTKLKK